MRTLTIILPIPFPELWPNARPHFHAKARATKRYRKLSHLVALSEGNRERWGEPAKAVTIRATFFLPCRKRDPDNCIAALKAAFDGLADAKIIANDRDLTILPPLVRPRSDWRKNTSVLNPCVCLEVTEE